MEITEDLKKTVWRRAQKVEGYDPDQARKDACDAWIIYDHFGNTDSDYGWEIDHIYPQSKLADAGIDSTLIDNVKNLRPLQWKNNRSKDNDYPHYSAVVTSMDEYNIDKESEYTVNQATQKELSELFGI